MCLNFQRVKKTNKLKEVLSILNYDKAEPSFAAMIFFFSFLAVNFFFFPQLLTDRTKSTHVTSVDNMIPVNEMRSGMGQEVTQ